MSEHLKNRLLDLGYIAAILLMCWAAYTGYVLMGAVNNVFTNNCNVVQAQALERAVEVELSKRQVAEAEEETTPSEPR